METISLGKAREIAPKQEKAVKSAEGTQLRSEFWELAEFNRFGIVPWLLVFVVSVGAATAGLVIDSDWKLVVIVLSTIIVEASALSLTSMKSLVIGSVISVTLNLLMVIM